jgi:hypothetical protein
MRVAVRIAGLAAAAALVLWCATIGIQSFTRQPGAGLHRLDGGAGLQVLLGLAALVGAGLVVAAAFALTRPACRGGQPFWLVVCLLGWAALAAAVASRAPDLLLAPVDYEMGVGPGETSVVAPAWETYFWTVAAVCAALAAVSLVRWTLAGRSAARVSRPAA